jgi:hypothetical protein
MFERRAAPASSCRLAREDMARRGIRIMLRQTPQITPPKKIR